LYSNLLATDHADQLAEETTAQSQMLSCPLFQQDDIVNLVQTYQFCLCMATWITQDVQVLWAA